MCATVMLLAGITITTLPAAQAAEGPSTHELGHQLQLVDGPVVQGWTISALRPSADAIPYPVRGVLWEAEATDVALQGDVIPVIPNFSARSRTGQAYRVLFEVATPQGINPAPLAAGQTASGTLYFDVTGDVPDQVAYAAGGRDLLIWNAGQPEVVAPAPSAASPPVQETAVGSPATAAEAAPPPADVAAAATTPPPPLWQGTARAQEPPARLGTPIVDVTPPAEPAPGWVGTPADGEPVEQGTSLSPAPPAR